MQIQEFAHNYHGVVRVDLCFTCAGIWFDRLASVELAPDGVVQLFKQIESRRSEPRRPVASRLSCPRCTDPLALSSDLSKAGRFSYFRCPRGDGRFTPFFQFLKEKQFVRTLNAAELQRVRAEVRQIQCSECGAPIDLQKTSQCDFCHAPVSFLDPDAVAKAMKMWTEAQDRRQAAPTPESLGYALRQMQLPQTQGASPARTGALHLLTDVIAGDDAPAVDLVMLGIRALGRLFPD
jgi:hypothetical protein